MVACLTKPDRAAARFAAAVILILAVQPGAVAAEWLEQNVGFSAPNMSVLSLDTVDENVAWLIAGGSLEFSRTTDGGSTWIPGTLTISAAEATAIAALDASTAWVTIKLQSTQRARVYKTADGGATWINQSTFTSYGISMPSISSMRTAELRLAIRTEATSRSTPRPTAGPTGRGCPRRTSRRR
jgi:hypothetical protein